MPMQDRYWGGQPNYTFGFNGKENDDEAKGYGNQVDYGMRIYDPRIGKFLSIDPLSKDYPMLTPYQYASNRPIDGVDRDGLEHEDSKGSVWDWIVDFFTSSQKFSEGASKVMEGAVEEASAETGQNDYHRKEVPPQIQHILDLQHKYSGVAKMFEGTTKMVESNGEAAANLIPLERVFSGVKYLSKGKGVLVQASIKTTEQLAPKAISPEETKAIVGFIKTIENQANKLSVEGAVWAQKTFGSKFDDPGSKFYGKTVEAVMNELKNGTMSAKDVPIDMVVRDGQTFILNTKSSAALTKAGIPRSSWNVVDRTGVKTATADYEKMLSDQLTRNKIPKGTRTIREANTQNVLTH